MAKNAQLPEKSPGPSPDSKSRDSGSIAAKAVSAAGVSVGSSAGMAPSDLVEIVKQHHEAVYRYAFRLSGASHDAEDLTQQTFLVAREKIDQLRDAQATRAWLYTVLRNCFLKELRQRQPVLMANFGETLEDLAAAPGAEPVDRESLQRALARLPDEFRLPLLLFYFEELSYREIATALNAPVCTVMSRLARAKAHLRRYWLDEEEKPRRPAPRESAERFTVEPHLAP
jgi:RNA polymerase sigma-70 factor (ECF subfamily)